VSVEKVEEALKAIEFDNVRSVQIIYNMFRLRPRERFLAEAARRGVAVIVRVPLASGLLTGQYKSSTAFGPAITGSSIAKAPCLTRARRFQESRMKWD